MVVFGLDYLSVERGMDTATVAVAVLTFPAGFLTTLAFLLLAVALGHDEYSPGPDTYAPSVYAVGGVVQVVLIWLVLRAFQKYREKADHL
jgi:multisubunit Na+/H+ antiporter MnhB subunit